MRRVAAVLILLAALSPAPAGRAEVPYRTTIEGAAAGDLFGRLDQISQLKALENRPPPTDEALRRRAEGDLSRLADAAKTFVKALFTPGNDNNGVFGPELAC